MISLEEIRRARERIGDSVRPSPLVQYDERVWLKLENLHPIGCFKLRGALNKVRSEAEVRDLVTASAGNMAQGVAWAAREVGVSATIVAPETAPRTKLDAAERLGARIVPVPYEEWLRGPLRRQSEEILLSKGAACRGYFRSKEIARLIRANSGPGTYSKELFVLLVVEIWHQQFVDRHSTNDHRPYSVREVNTKVACEHTSGLA